MASDIKTKIAIEGEQEYRRAIKSITQADKELDSELRLLASSFDKNATAQQKAAAKIPILTKQIENQKNKLATLTDLLAKQQKQYQDYGKQLEEVKAQYGEGSKEVTTAQRAYEDMGNAIAKTQADINNTSATINQLNAELGDLQTEASDAAQREKDLAEAQKRQAEESKKAAEKVAFYADKLNKALNVTLAFSAACLTVATTLGTQVVKAYGALEQAVGGAAAVFGDYADQIVQTSKTASKTLGTSQAEYLAVANKMGALFQGSGLSVERSMELTTLAIERAADAASVMGIDVSSALEAVTGAAKGNYTMMDNLGVAMNATTLEAYRLELGMDKAFSQMTNAEKAELSMRYFFERTTKYAGNFRREAAETIEGSLGSLSASFKTFVAGLGDSESDVAQLTEDVADSFVNVYNNVAPVIKRAATSIPNVVDTLKLKSGELDKSLGGTLTTMKNVALVGGGLVAGVKTLSGLTSLAKQADDIKKMSEGLGGLVEKLGSPKVAIGIAALVALSGSAVAVATSIHDARMATDEYYRAAQEAAIKTQMFQRNLESINTTYNENVSVARDTQDESLALIASYEKLAQKTNRTAGETELLKEVSSRLVEVMPELAGLYNEQTGLIDANVSSLKELVAMRVKEAEANALMNKAVDVQVQYNAALKEQERLSAKLAELKQRLAEIDTGSPFKSFEQVQIENDITSLSVALANQQVVVGELGVEVEKTNAEIEGLGETQEKVAVTTEVTAQKTQEAVEAQTKAMEEAQAAYDKTYEAARSSLDGQFSEWDKVENKTKTSVQEMIAAKKSQIEYFKNYTSNFNALTSRNIDGVNELAATFADGSMESAAALEALRTATDAEIEEIIAAMRETGQLKDILAGNFADATTAAKGQLNPNVFYELGVNCGEGYARGIESMAGRVGAAAARLSAAGQGSLARSDMIKSPSKKYMRLGKYDGEGFALGFEKSIPLVTRASSRLSEAAYASIQRAQTAWDNIPETGGSVNGGSTTTNWGGINIQVYGAEGQDVNALADAVMRRMQAEVNRREAVWQ